MFRTLRFFINWNCFQFSTFSPLHANVTIYKYNSYIYSPLQFKFHSIGYRSLYSPDQPNSSLISYIFPPNHTNSPSLSSLCFPTAAISFTPLVVKVSFRAAAAVAASPENLLEIWIIRPHPRPTESENFTSLLGDLDVYWS